MLETVEGTDYRYEFDTVELDHLREVLEAHLDDVPDRDEAPARRVLDTIDDVPA